MSKISPSDKQILFARKIKALAEEGDPGERDNARLALDRYLTKHGLTMDDIAEVSMKEYGLVTTKENERFARQVIASVIGQPSKRGRWTKGNGRTVYFKATYAEYIEIKDRFNHFWKSFKEEEEVFYQAFIQTNSLYANPDMEDDDEEQKPMTKEEKARMRKLFQMMDGITPAETYRLKLNK